jgi:type IV secretion system protein VirB2
MTLHVSPVPSVTVPTTLSTAPTRPETPVDPVEPFQPVPSATPKPSVLREARKHLASSTALTTIMIMAAAPAHASGSSMPWEEPLEQILESIEGPVAKIVAVIIIIATGLALAFGDTSGGFRRLIQIVFGLSIAFAASSFFLSFFSFGGGALV